MARSSTWPGRRPVACFQFVLEERGGGRLGGIKIVAVIEIKGLQVRPKRSPCGDHGSEVGPTEPAARRMAVKCKMTQRLRSHRQNGLPAGRRAATGAGTGPAGVGPAATVLLRFIVLFLSSTLWATTRPSCTFKAGMSSRRNRWLWELIRFSLPFGTV